MEPPAGKRPISINRLGNMTARLRIIVAASACLLGAGTPALAQDAAQNAVIGPPQLSNFSLNGTVTRAAPAPTPVRKQPPRQTQAERQPAAQAQTAQQSAPARSTPSSARKETAATREPARTSPEPQRDTAVADTAPLSTATVADRPVQDSLPALPTPSPAISEHSFPILPWIVAALAALAAAAWFFFFRNRPRESYAGVSGFELQAPPQDRPAPAPEPRAAPRPTEPKPAPQPQPAPTGVVSTRLRPWLEIQFKPDRAVVDDNRAAVAFEMSVVNSGNVPARDVLIEATLFNAGPMQDQQIQLFFDNPVAKGEPIPVIPPMQRITVNTAVFMARDQVVPIEIEGRPLFVPMIAFNALYHWGSSSEGQSSASYLVGKETEGEKLAPFRLDLGPRIFRGLGAREHQLHVRK
jgi:hypothetical protein